MAQSKKTKIFADNSDIVTQLNELSNIDIQLSTSRGHTIIQQTQRNQIRAELLQGMKQYLLNNGYAPLETEDGIVLEVDNDKILEQDNSLNGMISLAFNITIKPLDYDAVEEEEAYLMDKEN